MIIKALFLGGFVFTLSLSATPLHITSQGTLRLTADQKAIGRQIFHAAIIFDLKKGWHTYWKNPGHGGLPVSVKWQLPAGFKTGPLLWAVPKRFGKQGMVEFGYDGRVVLPVKIIPPENVQGKTVNLQATVTYLVCKDVCVPGRADLSLLLPVKQKPEPSKWAAPIARALKALPLLAAEAGLTVKAAKNGRMIDLSVTGLIPKHHPGRIVVFPEQEEVVAIDRPLHIRMITNGILIRVPLKKQIRGPLKFAAVMTAAQGWRPGIKAVRFIYTVQ